MNDNLPKGWERATFGDIATYISRGRSPTYAPHSSLPIINQRCIRWDGINEEHLKFVDIDTLHQWEEARFVRSGDVLWNSTGRGTIGRATLYAGLQSYSRAVVDSHVTIVRPADEIEPGYLFAYIKSPFIQGKMEEMQSGSTNQVELNRSTIEQTPIPIAPRSEQKRIIAKLSKLSARVAHAHSALNRIPVLLESYRQAVIDAAFTSLDLSVPLYSLVDQDRGIPYGIVQTGKHQKDGIPTVRAGDIKTFRLRENGLKKVSADLAAQYERTTLRGGEVLIAIRGSVGETCVVPMSMKGNNISREVALIPVSDAADPFFIMYFLKSSRASAYIRSNIKGIAQTGINLRDLRKLPCPNIPVTEQRKILGGIQISLAWLDFVASNHAAATKLLPVLDTAILSSAFSGKLVPQDPNDEPASKLLARIKAADVAAAAEVGRRIGQSSLVKRAKRASKMADLIEVLNARAGWMSAADASQMLGVEDGSSSDAVEEFYRDLRVRVLDGSIEVQRRGHEDWLRLAAKK